MPMPPREWPDYLSERMVARRAASEGPAGEKRPESGPTPWEIYGAPCLLVLAADEMLEPRYACFDGGILTQTICLAAEDRGLATCIMATAVRHADVLHELIPAAKNMKFVIGIAIGTTDHTAAVNRGERKRVELTELVTWVSE
jgi:nitroreductase